MESHGKLAPVSPHGAFHFHLVFSNKTQTDGYCLDIWAELTARGVLEMSEADEGADLAAIVRDGLARPPACSSAAALSPSEP